MSSLRFKVTDGPYAGDYDIDPDEFTGTEVSRFRQAVGISMTEGLSGGNVDLDVLCGLIWIIRSRTARGLAFAAVADNVHRRDFQPVAEETPPPADDPLDPTPSVDG